MLVCCECGWQGDDPKVIELVKGKWVEDLCPKCGSPDVVLIRYKIVL